MRKNLIVQLKKFEGELLHKGYMGKNIMETQKLIKLLEEDKLNELKKLPVENIVYAVAVLLMFSLPIGFSFVALGVLMATSSVLLAIATTIISALIMVYSWINIIPKYLFRLERKIRHRKILPLNHHQPDGLFNRSLIYLTLYIASSNI